MPMADALLTVALIVFILALRLLAIARKERRETRERMKSYLEETHKFLALIDTGAREEAGAVLMRLSADLRRWRV